MDTDVIDIFTFGMEDKRTIYVIGTIHGEETPDDELREILETMRPDQIFVELPDESTDVVEAGSIYPSEMVFVYEWAQAHNVAVVRFDVESDFQYFKDGKGTDSPEYKTYIRHQEEILSAYSWKDFNKPEYDKKLNHPVEDELFDSKQSQRREEKMLANIRSAMIEEGVIAIFTGTGHLDFFEKHFVDAHFPFR